MEGGTFSDSFKTVNGHAIEEDQDSLKQVGSFFPKFDSTIQLLNQIVNSYDINNSFNEEESKVRGVYGQIRDIVNIFYHLNYIL